MWSGKFSAEWLKKNIFRLLRTLHLTITVGINIHELPLIEVFPNPTNRILNIKGENMRRISIYSADGQHLYSDDVTIPDLEQVDVSRFASGQYFLKVTLRDDREITKKIIVKH